ncbi:hypothetical protein ACQUSR_30905 [Streptomyces sp. P1-3]|uniref:hypothetical protein n=1 Tax=Streptomyces sp. P1-3 TaxID=3421658 RepID=UPI003D35DC01
MVAGVKVVGDALELPGGIQVRFMRTLRIPETGTYPLPPGLGAFPLRHVADYPHTVPEEWRRRGGVMLPVYQREAMWLNFSAGVPAALKVGVGKVCAVSGKPWSPALSRRPQNYVAVPQQPWLDGINSGDGFIRQFVAVPMGLGATVEGQVTGEERWGGVQLAVHELTDTARAAWQRTFHPARPADGGYGGPPPPPPGAAPAGPAAPGGFGCPPPSPGAAPAARSMGLGAGGRMRQEVYADQRPLSDYQAEAGGRVFVHLASAAQWRQITGEAAPPTPVTPQAYAQQGLPWFDYYDADAADLPASAELSGVRPTGHWLADEQPGWTPPTPPPAVQLKDERPVSDGEW